MTRTEDITLTPTERTNRVKNAFGNYDDVLVISNHINAGGEKGSCSKITFFGRNVFYYKKKKCQLMCISFLYLAGIFSSMLVENSFNSLLYLFK